MSQQITIPTKVRAGLTNAFKIIRTHSEDARFRELATQHGAALHGVSETVVETKLREAATRCAAREHSLLKHVVLLIDQVSHVAELVKDGGPRFESVTWFGPVTTVIERLARDITADRHELMVLGSIARDSAP